MTAASDISSFLNSDLDSLYQSNVTDRAFFKNASSYKDFFDKLIETNDSSLDSYSIELFSHYAYESGLSNVVSGHRPIDNLTFINDLIDTEVTLKEKEILQDQQIIESLLSKNRSTEHDFNIDYDDEMIDIDFSVHCSKVESGYYYYSKNSNAQNGDRYKLLEFSSSFYLKKDFIKFIKRYQIYKFFNLHKMMNRVKQFDNAVNINKDIDEDISSFIMVFDYNRSYD